MKINPNKSITTFFEILMENVSDKPEAKFGIKTEKMDILLPCEINGNSIKIDIPKLNNYKNIFEEDIFEAYIQIKVNDNFYIPWSGKIELEKEAQINIKESEQNKNITIKENSKIFEIDDSENSEPKENKKEKTNHFKKFIKK